MKIWVLAVWLACSVSSAIAASYQEKIITIRENEIVAREKSERERAVSIVASNEVALVKDTKRFFSERIEGRFATNGTETVFLNKCLSGKVIQVMDGTRLLLSRATIEDMNFQTNKAENLSLDTCIVTLDSTVGWGEGDRFPGKLGSSRPFVRVTSNGTESYQSLLGARRTVQVFRLEKGIDCQTFRDLSESNKTFLPLSEIEKRFFAAWIKAKNPPQQNTGL